MDSNSEEEMKKFLGEMMLQIGTLSSRSANTLSLYQQMMKLNSVLDDLDQIKNQDNRVVQQFYRTFRGIFKQYQEDGHLQEIGQFSSMENLPDEYIDQIKEKLCKMTTALRGLFNSIVSNTSIHLLWYFMNPSKQDQEEADHMISYFQKTYEKKSTVKFYKQKDLFLKELKEFGEKSNPIIAFVSTNNYRNEQNELIDCYNQILKIKNDNQNIKVQGIILQVEQENSYQNLIELMKTKEKPLFNVVLTFDHFELYNEVFKLMNPQEFRRVIPSDEINLYYHQLKAKFFSLHTDDFSDYNLYDFHPEKIQLQSQLEKAIDLMKRREIKVDKLILDNKVAYRLTKDIIICFQDSKGDENVLAERILRNYTLESCFLYKFINGCMNTLNEDVVTIIWDFILMLRIALYKYDDSKNTKIIKSNEKAPIMYRGINLSQDYFNRVIKVGKIICLASFSSFTLQQKIAEQFIFSDDHFSKDRASVIFEYEHKISTLNYPQRPKEISSLGPFQVEEEYLLPPSYQFKIYKIDQPTNQIPFYKVYITQGNQTTFNKQS